MRALTENRVDQAFRHLQPREAEKVSNVLHMLERDNFENLRTNFQVRKLLTPGEQVFVLRATPSLRI